MTAYAFRLDYTQYDTEYKYRPVREIAEAKQTARHEQHQLYRGRLRVGVAMPVLVISAALLSAYWCGCNALPGLDRPDVCRPSTGVPSRPWAMLAPCATHPGQWIRSARSRQRGRHHREVEAARSHSPAHGR